MLNIKELLYLYKNHPKVLLLNEFLTQKKRIHLSGLHGSSSAFVVATIKEICNKSIFYIAQDKESAAYLFNDFERLLPERKIHFLPSSYKRALVTKESDSYDPDNLVLRTQILSAIATQNDFFLVTYPEALHEKVVQRKVLKDSSIVLKKGEKLDQDFLLEYLTDLGFKRKEFVFEAGEFAVRGSIIDVFSFSNDYPFRIDFFDVEVDSLRTFDTVTQLSLQVFDQIIITPHFLELEEEVYTSIIEYLKHDTLIIANNLRFTLERLDFFEDRNKSHFETDFIQTRFVNGQILKKDLLGFQLLEISPHSVFENSETIVFKTAEQISFKKNFDFLVSDIKEKNLQNYRVFILSANSKQLERINRIFSDLNASVHFEEINSIVYLGFIDHDLQISIYADHQIFERYLRFELKKTNSQSGTEALTLRELSALQPGDYVVHIDHGIGIFGGLEKMEVNGKFQEAVRLVYKDNDVLFVSLHALHKISKYKGKEGEPPKVYKLGSKSWSVLKNKTKSKVKDIAKELIALYAQRLQEKGYAFSADTYMQDELESSFIYEDTPDQLKATIATKQDMESLVPMDRLICGDVGFGKTEIAIRAAFKAVADNKQVAVLVPTTILAFQHFRTFSERLKDFPANVTYLSRNRSAKEQKQLLLDLAKGKVDIIIGTHRLVSKDVVFKDLGLLVIDEEQKFGVAVKEKLKALRVNVDTLTLSATPIPRTLQFSLMGARDMSIINTPPPNRFPIITELIAFNEEIIANAIKYEIERNGQVFFIHNRVKDIEQVANIIRQIVPGIRVVVAHGQMDGTQMENILVDFINEECDVLVATSIVENGLDIPNANTMIINNAQNFGLSDLHQLRGRVGRSNKKAFCYLITPPVTGLARDSRRRIQAIEQFSEIGSGFNIAMQDLDIRGAGNLLGGEQSGFIADIGFETYQRILDEAVMELRNTEFKNLFDKADSKEEKEKLKSDFVSSRFVDDCSVDTDVDIRFPEGYIESITERFKLYKELDNLSEEAQIDEFLSRLIDRFGQLPPEAADLIMTMRLRNRAQKLGIEKISFKQGKLILYFVADKDSLFYQSEIFVAILDYVQKYPKKCLLKQNEHKLYLLFNSVKSIAQINSILIEFYTFTD